MKDQSALVIYGLDVERLGKALAAAEINCWANPVRHEIDDPDEYRRHHLDAVAVAAAYARLEPHEPPKETA